MASKIDSKSQNLEQTVNKNKDSLMPTTSSIHTDNRFGRKSRSMFFIRHTAHPKNLRFITGVGGIQVCAMKEDSYNLPDNVLEQIRSSTFAAATMNPSILTTQKSIEHYISDPKYALRFDSSSYNQELLKKYEKKIVSKNRKERILPPIKHWTTTYTLADDTKRWKLELNNLAKKVGILTNEEVETEPVVKPKNDQIKIESLEIRNVQSLEFQRSTTQGSSNFSNNQNKTQNTGIHRKKGNQDENVLKEERVKTGRFNESRGSALGTRKLASSRLRSSLNFNANKNGKVILCIEEAEREMWLLQILCQILNTESMQDIQSWLVSSGFQEKEAMKELIQKALDGLNQSGRIDLDKINLNPNDKTTQVDFELIRNSITTMIENSKNVQFANNNNLITNQNNNLNIQFNENKNEEMGSNNNQNNQNNNSIVNADNIVIRIKLHDSAPKADEASAVIPSAPKQNDEENQLTSGSEFKSVSLINMDPYKFERTRTMSTFENYLSKSTYFQSKSKTNDFAIPKKHESSVHRPFTCKETKNDPFQNVSQSLEILNQPLSKKFMNKFSRVELVDVKNLCSKEDSVLEEPESSTSNVKVQTKKSVVKNDDMANPSNVKLKLETNKDSQVLTIEDN